MVLSMHQIGKMLVLLRFEDPVKWKREWNLCYFVSVCSERIWCWKVFVELNGRDCKVVMVFLADVWSTIWIQVLNWLIKSFFIELNFFVMQRKTFFLQNEKHKIWWWKGEIFLCSLFDLINCLKNSLQKLNLVKLLYKSCHSFQETLPVNDLCYILLKTTKRLINNR